MPLSDPGLLRRAEMFEGLADAQLLDVAAAGMVRRLPAGERIFAQGDPGLSCHSLLSGRIKILQTLPDGSQSVLRFIGPGEMYGTVAALMDQPFPADALAVTESVEIRWTVSAFRDLMRRHPEIDFPITRQDLAEMTGSTLHTVSRTLAGWDQAGVTASRRRGVTVRDMAELARLAQD